MGDTGTGHEAAARVGARKFPLDIRKSIFPLSMLRYCLGARGAVGCPLVSADPGGARSHWRCSGPRAPPAPHRCLPVGASRAPGLGDAARVLQWHIPCVSLRGERPMGCSRRGNGPRGASNKSWGGAWGQASR